MLKVTKTELVETSIKKIGLFNISEHIHSLFCYRIDDLQKTQAAFSMMKIKNTALAQQECLRK